MKKWIHGKSLMDWHRLILSVLMGIVGIWLIVTFAKAVSYTFPSVIDDVGTAMYKKTNMDTYHVNAIGAGLIQAWFSYKTWQGIYFTQTVDVCLMPISEAGIIQIVPFRFYMVFFFLVFICSCLFFIWNLIRQIVESEHVLENTIVCFTVFFFLITLVKAWRELFYWFQGMICYCLPVSMFFVVWGMVLLNGKKERKGVYIGAAIIGFLASGSALVVPAMGCYILLLIAVFNRNKKGIWAVFGASVSGALINVAAPGNFQRKNIIDATGYHVWKVLKVSLGDCITSVKDFLGYKYVWLFWAGLFLMVFLGLLVKKEIETKKLLWMDILLLPLPWITVFPAELGYAGGGVPNRVIFCVDITVLGIFMIWAFSLGYIIRVLLKQNTIVRTYIGGVIVGFVLMLFMNNTETMQSVYLVNVDTCRQLRDGSIKTFTQGVLDIYEYLEKTDENNIVVTEIPASIRNYEVFVFVEDPEHAMWEKLCRYYNRESIRYEKRN